MQKTHKKVVVQVNDQALNGKNTVLVMNVLVERKRVCDSSCIHESEAFLLFRDVMNVPPLLLSNRS